MQCKVETVLRCNGVSYEAGEIIELSDDEAKELTESGAVTPINLPFSQKLNSSFGGK